MLFFVVQAIVAAVVIGRGRATGAAVLIAFSIGGAITYAIMRTVYATAKTEGVPRIRGESLNPLPGLAVGFAAGAAGLLYLYELSALGILEEAARDSGSYAKLGVWVWPLAVIAAPIFEEFIFRGLIFGGLRRSFGLWPATLASAAVFAIMHPAISIAPVFVMGVCTAWLYERTRGLLAPMLAHATYNACVIGVPAFFV
jgi:membrane protease YdiL (CAAX protease family)